MTNRERIKNRESFLNHIAKTLGRERRKDVKRPVWEYQPQWEVYKDFSQDNLVQTLKEHCKKIHTDVKEATSENLSSTISDVIQAFAGKSVVIWDDERFSDYGLIKFLHHDLPEQNIDVHVWDTELGNENMDIAAKADVGITFADKTLAESGTVVLHSGHGKGRSVSLLPKTYIAIIPKSTIVPRISHEAREIHKKIENGKAVASCVNFISGPSNSADIEMNLIVGVHGPIKATYIIIEDQ